MEFLLSRGYDANLTGPDCDTPMHVSVSSGNFEIVKLLIKNGAVNVNVQNEVGDVRPCFFVYNLHRSCRHSQYVFIIMYYLSFICGYHFFLSKDASSRCLCEGLHRDRIISGAIWILLQCKEQ